jgi:phage replication initiation protein
MNETVNDKEFWKWIKETSYEYETSTEKVALFANMSRMQLNRLKKGKAVLTDKYKAELTYALEKLKPYNPLTMLIDYCRIRFPTTDAEEILLNVMKMQPNGFLHEAWGFNGYSGHYEFGEIIIYTSDKKELGTLVEMKGFGCRQFETFLEIQNRTWEDFFKDVNNYCGIYKRVDIAINDTYGILDIHELYEKTKRHEIVSPFRKFSHYESGERNDDDGKIYMGETLYIGSMQSELYFCIYQKDYEQYVKIGQELEEAPVKNRFEIRLKNERAATAIETLVRCRDVETVAFGIINEYVRFIDLNKSRPERSPINAKWQHFIGCHKERLKLTMAPKPYSLARTMNWLGHQVLPTLKGVKEFEKLQGTNSLEQMIENSKVSDKFAKIIKQQQLSPQEIVVVDDN